MTSCGAGTYTVRKTRPSAVSSMPLLLLRRCSDKNGRSGSLAISVALTRRWRPLSTLVTTITARRAARSALRAVRMSSFMGRILLHLFHEHPDSAAAGQADLPGGLIGDAEFQHFRLAALDHIERLGDHGALDAAAGHRAEKIALLVDNEVRADRARRRAPGLDHRRQRHRAPVLAPILGGFENVVVGCEHGGPPLLQGRIASDERQIGRQPKVVTRFPIRHSPFRHSLYSMEYSASRHILQPCFRIAGD